MQSFVQKVVSGADLEHEPLPLQPIVEIFEDKRILIEHHQGVSEYSDKVVCVKVKFGHIRLEGDCLTLSNMTKERLVICGNIFTLAFVRGCQH